MEGVHRNDFKMVQATLTSLPVERPMPTPEKPQGLCGDKGDAVDDVRERLATCESTAHIRARGAEAHAIKHEAGYKARRGVVERTHGWRNRCRRGLVRWGTQVCNYLVLLHRACAYITYRRSGLLGWALRLQYFP